MHDTTPKTRRRYCPISIAACIAAALVMITADIKESPTMFGAGLTVFMLAATALITLRTGVNTEVIEAARQAGYDAGYFDGQSVRIAQPIELRRVI